MDSLEDQSDYAHLLPIYLLADSQLLFWVKENGQNFFAWEFEQLAVDVEKALYIGAANGDQAEYFELFRAAMEECKVEQCEFLKADTPLEEAQQRIAEADLILLSGGDVEVGWTFLEPLKMALEDAYFEGAVLVGVSAGAIHLSSLAWPRKEELCESDLYSVIGLVPCLVDVHDEKDNWRHLKQAMRITDGCFSGIGIPSGAGVAVEYNGRVTALKNSVDCLDYDQCIFQSSLKPDEDDL